MSRKPKTCACGLEPRIPGQPFQRSGHMVTECLIEGLGWTKRETFEMAPLALMQRIGIATQQKDIAEKANQEAYKHVEMLRRALDLANENVTRWQNAATALAQIVGTGVLHG